MKSPGEVRSPGAFLQFQGRGEGRETARDPVAYPRTGVGDSAMLCNPFKAQRNMPAQPISAGGRLGDTAVDRQSIYAQGIAEDTSAYRKI